MIGKRFGRITVLRDAPRKRDIRFWCRCDCGKEWAVNKYSLTAGQTRSCGCWARFAIGERRRTHGKSKTREHNIWCALRKRCLNPNASNYHLYGGRGISVCERWNSFTKFLTDMGPCPPGYSIERINNDGDYKPSNCRWATRDEQAGNRRGVNRIEYQGRIYTAASLAKAMGIKQQTFHYRLCKKKWPLEKALTYVRWK